jgi:hypothetical protein
MKGASTKLSAFENLFGAVATATAAGSDAQLALQIAEAIAATTGVAFNFSVRDTAANANDHEAGSRAIQR